MIDHQKIADFHLLDGLERGTTLLELLAALVISTVILGFIIYIFSFETASFNEVVSRQHVYTSLELVETDLQQFVQNMTFGSAHVNASGVLIGTDVYGDTVDLQLIRLPDGQNTFQETAFNSSGVQIKRVTWNTPYVNFRNSSMTVQQNIVVFHLNATAIGTSEAFHVMQDVQYVAGGGY